MSKKKGNEKKNPGNPKHTWDVKYTWDVTPWQLSQPAEVDLVPVQNGKGQYATFKEAKKELLGSIDEQIAYLEHFKRGFKKLRAKNFTSREPK